MNLTERYDERGMRWYEHGGRTLPSVTSVLGWCLHHPEWARFDRESDAFVRGQAIGTAVHRACELYVTGRRIKAESIEPDEVAPRLEQFRQFVAETGFVCRGAEVRLASKAYGFAGRLDLVGNFEEKTRAIVDLTISHDHWLKRFQTAAYLQLDRENGAKGPTTRWVLELPRAGRWKLTPFQEPSTDWQIFLSALNCFRAAHAAGKL